MSVLRRIVTSGGGLAMALMAAPIISHAQVVAPGTNPRPTPAPTTNPPSPTTTTTQTVDPEIRNDLPFLREAAGANLMEIRLGQLALSRASNSSVKQFGQRMVTDHTRLEQELSSLVAGSGNVLNAALSTEHYAKINQLQNLTGQQFDQAYITMMIQAHQADAARFQSETRDGDSPRVRDLAAKALPVLQQHLSLAQDVGRQINVQVVTTPTAPAPTQPGQVSNPTAQAASQQARGRADVRADSKFIHEVAADNLLEVRMAELAERKARNSDVKQFAERIAAEHGRLQEQWLGMASRNGQQFKAGIGKNHREKLDRLEKLSGRAFDRAYMTTEVQNHKDYIDYFQKEGRGAHSSQVRELVQRDLPTLRMHFNQAKRIGGQVGADTAATLRSEKLSKK
jgi:putative membrane protein